MKVVIIGCGYLGLRLGSFLSSTGHEVIGIRRSAEHRDRMLSHGIRLFQADVTQIDSMSSVLEQADCVVNTVSSSKGGKEVYRLVYLDATCKLMEYFIKQNRSLRYVHVSSTSVYAQNDEGWVNEECAAVGASETSKVLVETENEIRRYSTTSQGARPQPLIVRSAGIYGAGRGHAFKQFLAGEAVLDPNRDRWMNMIHVDDLVAACAKLLAIDGLVGTFNVVDNEPTLQSRFYGWLAKRLERPMPPALKGSGVEPQRKRGDTNKRVSNAKLRAVIGDWLKYPSFREGYEAEIRLSLPA